MQIEPPADAFAARYGRGEAQVVWTTLVADLETPVSAFLKIAGGRPMSFLLESVEGGAVRGRYSVIGLDPDVIWRTLRRARRDQPRGADAGPINFTPCKAPPLEALRALIAESRIELPDGLPPMAAGVFGYLGYDMVRLMEELPASHPDPIGLADAVLIRPTLIVVFDAVKDSITVVTPVRPEAGVTAKAALTRAEERLSAVVDALDRPLDKAAAGAEAGPLDVPAKSNTTPDGIPGDGGEGEGVHPRRRHLPGGAVAALRGAVRPAAVRALPRAAAGQSGAVSLLPRFRRLRDRGIEPGNPGPHARRTP